MVLHRHPREIARDESGERWLADRLLRAEGGEDHVRCLTRDHVGKGLAIWKYPRLLHRTVQRPEHIRRRLGHGRDGSRPRLSIGVLRSGRDRDERASAKRDEQGGGSGHRTNDRAIGCGRQASFSTLNF